MSGLDRYIAVLSQFGETRSSLTVAELAEATGIPASSVYRSVRDLVAVGMLDPATDAHYRLGAVFLEFDRLIRLTDPLVVEGTPLLGDIAREAKVPCVVVLARLFGDRVMCVADASSVERTVRTSYERGRPMPLTRGATSKSILSQLPARRLKRLLETDDTHVVASDLTTQLAAVRRRGFCIARGEVDAGLVGLAVPVACPESAIVASLSLITEASVLDPAVERRVVMMLIASGSLLADALRRRAMTSGSA